MASPARLLLDNFGALDLRRLPKEGKRFEGAHLPPSRRAMVVTRQLPTQPPPMTAPCQSARQGSASKRRPPASKLLHHTFTSTGLQPALSGASSKDESRSVGASHVQRAFAARSKPGCTRLLWRVINASAMDIPGAPRGIKHRYPDWPSSAHSPGLHGVGSSSQAWKDHRALARPVQNPNSLVVRDRMRTRSDAHERSSRQQSILSDRGRGRGLSVFGAALPGRGEGPPSKEQQPCSSAVMEDEVGTLVGSWAGRGEGSDLTQKASVGFGGKEQEAGIRQGSAARSGVDVNARQGGAAQSGGNVNAWHGGSAQRGGDMNARQGGSAQSGGNVNARQGGSAQSGGDTNKQHSAVARRGEDAIALGYGAGRSGDDAYARQDAPARSGGGESTRQDAALQQEEDAHTRQDAAARSGGYGEARRRTMRLEGKGRGQALNAGRGRAGSPRRGARGTLGAAGRGTKRFVPGAQNRTPQEGDALGARASAGGTSHGAPPGPQVRSPGAPAEDPDASAQTLIPSPPMRTEQDPRVTMGTGSLSSRDATERSGAGEGRTEGGPAAARPPPRAPSAGGSRAGPGADVDVRNTKIAATLRVLRKKQGEYSRGRAVAGGEPAPAAPAGVRLAGPENGEPLSGEAFLRSLGASSEEASDLWTRSLDTQGLLPQLLRQNQAAGDEGLESALGSLCSVLLMCKVKREEIVACLATYPPFLQCDPSRVRNEAADLIRRYDISTAAVGVLIRHNPGVLCDVELSRTMHSMFGFLRRVGLQPNALCEVIAACPAIFTRVQLEEAVQVTRFLRRVYLDQGRVIKTVTAQPQIFLTGAQRPYENICREFFRLGIKEHIVRGMVSRYPLMLGRPVSSFKPVVEMLEAANIHGRDLQETLVEYPQVLYRDQEDTQRKLGLLLHYLPNPAPRLKVGPAHFFPKSTLFTVGPRFAFVRERAPHLRDQLRLAQLLKMDEAELADAAGVELDTFLSFKNDWIQANQHLYAP